jgi:putative membrane protein
VAGLRHRPGPGNGWLHAKLAVVLLLIGYHAVCARLLRASSAARPRPATWFRWFNELPVLLLLAAVILVVVKPF